MRIFRQTCPALAAGILTLAGGTWLPAQKIEKPVNVDGKILRDAGNVAKDALPGSWLSYGRNQSETRYSTLKGINDTNAKRLGLAWTYAVGAVLMRT
jgi:glucose dehydrogenase